MRRQIILLTIFALFLPLNFALAGNLPVPFSVQAPEQDWRQPWHDACEEAAIVLVDQYYAGRSSITAAQARGRILEVFRIKNNYLGWSLDEAAAEIVFLINNFFPWEARVVFRPTLAQIKQELDAGQPVLAPNHGQSLGNPYFRGSGPLYHVIIISGYDDQTQEFITQEVGTIHGENYRYSYQTVMNALHDYLPDGRTAQSQPAAIFTQKQIQTSANLDADRDGLNKQDEIKHGTVLFLADSDGDGYSDGDEVRLGYSPIVNQNKIPNQRLVKAPSRPEIYFIDNGVKQHVLNLAVLQKLSGQWGGVVLVEQSLLNILPLGPALIN